MKRLMLLNLVVLLLSCAVEAGNPSTKKPTGTVSVQFAKTEDSENQSFQLMINRIELAADDTTTASLNPDVNEIELFSGSQADDVLAVKGQEVAVGKYAKIYVRLDEKRPPVYRGRDGKEMRVEIDHLEDRAFYFAESFEVKEGEETKVLVSLDPRRSLIASKDRPGNMVFEPMGGAFPKPKESRFEGTAPSAEFVTVCAYAYGFIQPPPPPFSPQGDDRNRPDKQFSRFMIDKGPGRLGSAARPPKVFDSKDVVVKDETAQCDNAFARAPVQNQKYVLSHLPPGSYLVRFFKADGKYQDAEQEITVVNK